MQQRNKFRVGGYQPEPETVDPSFRILKDLAQDLSKGQVAFPTFINATLQIRRALNDPRADAERVARAVGGEPLLAAKLVQVANSVAIRGPGARVSDVKGAVLRIGFGNVQAIATSLAMTQLVVAKEMTPFLKDAEAVWRHSLDVAAIAFVVVKGATNLNPDEALFAGLVHDVGRFYLLSKMPKYPELGADRVAMEAVIAEWHPQIGHAVLGAFGVSDAVLNAVLDHESSDGDWPPSTLSDAIALANRVSKGANPLNPEGTATAPDMPDGHAELMQLLADSSEELISLVAAFRA